MLRVRCVCLVCGVCFVYIHVYKNNNVHVCVHIMWPHEASHTYIYIFYMVEKNNSHTSKRLTPRYMNVTYLRNTELYCRLYM